MTSSDKSKEDEYSKEENEEIVTAIQPITNYINSLQTDQPFTHEAVKTLNQKILSFIQELFEESIRVSRRNKCDSVQSRDVNFANDHLVTSYKKRLYNHMGTIGGILLGVAIPIFFTLVTTRSIDNWSAILMILGTLIGGILIAWDIAKDV